MTIFYRYRYIDYSWLTNIWLLILISSAYIIFLLTSKNKKVIIPALFLNIFTPNGIYALYQGNDFKIRFDTSRKILIILLIILFLTPVLYINQYDLVGKNINPALEKFIRTNIPEDSKVLLATTDPNIIGILQNNHDHLIRFDDAMRWNWSNRKFIKQKLIELSDTSIKLQCKYIIMRKQRTSCLQINSLKKIILQFPEKHL